MPKRKGTIASQTTPSNKKDIRSYFTTKSSANKTPVTKVDLSDDDVIPESPEVQIISKAKPKKKRVIEDSSDEEIFTTKEKKKSDNNKQKPKSNLNTNKTDKVTLKEVKAVDLFGNGPIKRTEPIVKKEKKTLKTELGIHDDDDFEKSLLEIDNIDNMTLIENVHEKDKSSLTSADVKSEYFDKVSVKISPSKLAPPDTNDQKSPKKTEISMKKLSHKSPSKCEEKVKKTITDKSTKTKDKLESINNSEKTSKPTKIDQSIENNKKITEKKGSLKSPEKNNLKEVSNDVRNLTELSSKKSKNSSSRTKMSKNKRPFAEFIDDSCNGDSHTEQNHESKNKKKKLDDTLNNSAISDEERYEKRRHSAILYQNYLNRSGPKHLGTKTIPEGSPNCLKDCAFLLTGVLDSFEREEIAEAINKYGGTVKSGISKKVTHLLAGDDAGPAKIAKAQDLGVKIINEDEFLNLIIELSKSNATKDKVTPNKENGRTNKRDSSASKEKSETSKKTKASAESMKSFEEKIKKNFYSKSKSSHNNELPVKSKSSDNEPTRSKSVEKISPNSDQKETKIDNSIPTNSQMWVEKYKPQSIKQIIGQHGDASNVKKLMNWLTKWYIKRKEKIPKPSPWAKNDDGGYFKAALLSGPPGVGKTTTVSLVCKELGFDTVEFNASDTRSKTLIKGQIGELLTTTSLSGYAKGETGKQAITKKHVLVMDEVDGMAGNEDRGGLQELISLIKTTAVPIICMCNDRNSEKMRSLVNYCYDLKFSRPRVDQIKAAMLSVCCRESIKIPQDALTQLIIASNNDVRQTLNSLSMWAIDPDLNDAEKLKDDAQMKKKDLKLGPWEAVRKVFSAEEHKTMSLIDKSDLFFYDYNIAPLFVQENYLNVTPHCPKQEMLQRFSEAADSISLGDTIEARIRRNQAWNLLPVQAMLSSVIPGTVLSGHVSGQIQFPGWLGKNSRSNKMHRLAQEIHAHTRLTTTGSKSSIYLDYAKALRDSIVNPLVKDKTDGIQASIDVLNAYNLLREDLDSLTELSMWPGQRDPMILVESKVKAAMTRAYNKQAPALPHAGASFTKGKRNKDSDSGENEMEDEDVADDSEPENDGMIKVKKKSDNVKASTSNNDKGKKGKRK